MSLAGGREPRKTAGNRMSKLLDAEEEDEFYKTTYGGFNDVSSPTVDVHTKRARPAQNKDAPFPSDCLKSLIHVDKADHDQAFGIKY